MIKCNDKLHTDNTRIQLTSALRKHIYIDTTTKHSKSQGKAGKGNEGVEKIRKMQRGESQGRKGQ